MKILIFASPRSGSTALTHAINQLLNIPMILEPYNILNIRGKSKKEIANLQNNLPSLAAMGVRSLLEKVMISKTGDKGSFFKNINEFESMGYVSRIQKERLESILDAGHATIHRNFIPCRADIITLVELTEHIIETVYLHEDKVNNLKNRVPTRKITIRTKAKK
jgi:hypothetical protein